MRAAALARIFVFAVLAGLVALAASGTGRADAPAQAATYDDADGGDVLAGLAALPSMLPPPPAGFGHRRTSEADYVYPAHFRDDLAALDRVRAEAWRVIGDDLGMDPAARVVVRIGRNPEEMRALAPRGLPPPSYASGVAYPELGLILLTLTTHDPNDPVPNTAQVLTHELSHVALHRAAAGRPVPRWFSEGIAVHHSGENGLDRIRTLWEGTSQGRLLPIRTLSSGFADHGDRVDLAYAQAADVVAFMLRQPRGRDKMRRLLGAIREGASFERALQASYFFDIGDLQRAWRHDLDERHSSLPLIFGGGGIWALALVALAIGYLRKRRVNRTKLARWANEEAAIDSLEAELARKLAAVESARTADSGDPSAPADAESTGAVGAVGAVGAGRPVTEPHAPTTRVILRRVAATAATPATPATPATEDGHGRTPRGDQPTRSDDGDRPHDPTTDDESHRTTLRGADFWERREQRTGDDSKSGIPTVERDGERHTLH